MTDKPTTEELVQGIESVIRGLSSADKAGAIEGTGEAQDGLKQVIKRLRELEQEAHKHLKKVLDLMAEVERLRPYESEVRGPRK